MPVCERPFVKAHADYDLDKADMLLKSVLKWEQIKAENKGQWDAVVLPLSAFFHSSSDCSILF
jgi:hypothetical protein